MRKAKEPPRLALTIVFTLIVFCILIITMAIIALIVLLLIRAGKLTAFTSPNFMLPIVIIAVASVVVGTVVTIMISHIPLKPLNALISGMNNLAVGNYDTRLNLGIRMAGADIEGSFNTLAAELQNTEMLRSDFVNNFSHEFKTPLVSIRGFARLLQKGNLPDEKARKYLGIIVDESTRLADMATKVLDLTKLENQAILTDITKYNLSEQLRGCILLLEKKWVEKGLTICADFDEYSICGNEEMLKQVWINLIDNAVKFSSDGGVISVSIEQQSSAVFVSISNTGNGISSEDQKRIFQKFYQADTSHSAEGTGTGLAIVKRITELHRGKVSVESADDKTVFTVELPYET